jgi:hypothetical protein
LERMERRNYFRADQKFKEQQMYDVINLTMDGNTIQGAIVNEDGKVHAPLKFFKAAFLSACFDGICVFCEDQAWVPFSWLIEEGYLKQEDFDNRIFPKIVAIRPHAHL